MGKVGRFACIFTPMALTIASLLCLILVFSGQTSKKMDLQKDLFFFKANPSEFNADIVKDDVPDVPNTNIDNKLLEALQGVSINDDLKDFYKVGLWNYCSGDIDDSGKEEIKYCSARKANFWFNPVEVWGLKDSAGKDFEFPDKMQDGIKLYHKLAAWMFTAYLIAIVLTLAELIVGIFAIFSRWGSLATTIVSTAQTVFILAAAATSTAVYGTLVSVFETALKPYNIKAELGEKMLVVVWLGVAFSVASGFFWLISVCCCSGKSPHKKVVVEKTPYTYERVASPYLGHRDAGHHAVPPAAAAGHGTSGSAYEPFRHQQHV